MRISCYARIRGSLSGCQKTLRWHQREAESRRINGGQEQESGDDEPEADPVLPTISPEDAETLEEPEENGGARRRSRRIFPMRNQRMEAIRLTSYRKWIQYWTGPDGTDVTRRGDGQLFRWYPCRKPDRSGEQVLSKQTRQRRIPKIFCMQK